MAKYHKTPLKILYGITKSNFGGAQRYVYELARESKTRGHDTAVLLGGSGILKEKLDSRGVRTIPLPLLGRDVSFFKDAKELSHIIHILKQEKPDVFHINSSKLGGLGAFAARVAGIKKIVFTAHGWEFNGPRPKWQKPIIKFFSWLTVMFAHETICVSESIRRDMAALPFTKNRLALVKNGCMPFDLLSREEARKELGLNEDTYVVGTIAELRRIKGLDILLTAWADFSKNRNVKLVIIGDGEEGENLTALAKRLGISESVYFAGFVDNARKFLRAFDVFVLASRSEALGYVLIEAGYASLPVIATAVGGVPEVIKEDETGLLIQPEYPEELRHVLDGMRRDEALRKRLGEALNKSVREEFSLKLMFDKTFALYQ